MSNETSPEATCKLAVLIDADNMTPALISEILAEVTKYGTAIVKRIYGNWASPRLKAWKQHLLDHAIQPRQQFDYTIGKNATDIAMIIDAMDLLYTRRFEAFCLVSSDSDFTPLAMRIREEGTAVYGIGEKKTPRAFISACDKFIFTEVLTPSTGTMAPSPQTMAQLQSDSTLINLLSKAANTSFDDAGWSNLGPGGSNITKRAPEFDPRNYGYDQLSDLVRATGLYNVKQSEESIYIRPKPDSTLTNLLRKAVNASSDDDGWSDLGLVGRNLAKQAPEFDPRNTIYGKLIQLVYATSLYIIEQRGPHTHIRPKSKK